MNRKSLETLLEQSHSAHFTRLTALLIFALFNLVLALHDMLLLAHG